MVFELEIAYQTLHVFSAGTLGLPDVELLESDLSRFCTWIILGILDAYTQIEFKISIEEDIPCIEFIYTLEFLGLRRRR